MGHRPISWLKTVIEPTKERVKRKNNENSKIVVDSKIAGRRNITVIEK